MDANWWPGSLEAVTFLHTFCLANVVLGLWSLLARVKFATPFGAGVMDGAQICRALWGRVPTAEEAEANHLMAQSCLFRARGEIDMLKPTLASAQLKYPTNVNLSFALGTAHLMTGDDEAARSLFVGILAGYPRVDIMRAHILAHLAWANLMLAQEATLNDADLAVAEAITIAPWDAHVQHVAGAVLLVNGEITAAREMLQRAYNGLDDYVARGMCLCALSICTVRDGQTTRAPRLERKARKLYPSCRLLSWIENGTPRASKPARVFTH